MYFSNLNECLFDLSYLTLALEVANKNRDVGAVKILMYAYVLVALLQLPFFS